MAPMELAPSLFSLARHKQISVADAIREGGWMKGLQHMTTADLLHSFVTLWHKFQQFQANEEDDKITWNLMVNGDYSAKSAYEQQFIARIPMPRLLKVWKTKGESKVKKIILTLI